MFGLEIAAVGLLHLASSERKTTADFIKSQVECRAKVPPKVRIKPTKAKIQYDFTKSKEDLKNFDIDTVSPYGPGHETHVGGLMRGEIQMKKETSFLQETYAHLGYGCFYVGEIDVGIHMEPTIFVANEHKKGTCKHRVILEHEKKHVREDQLIVNKYAGLVGKEIKSFLKAEGYSYGPFKISELEKWQKDMQEALGALVIAQNDAMNKERRKRQQAIDSLEEYERISKACP
ncbi:MAG: hypothetical protein AAF988_05910 [Pseudomonadota bacterium]